MDRMKIFIYGFAHSGTTILRKLIGDHSEVFDYVFETTSPPPHGSDRHIVFKCPGLPDWRYEKCKRIMIIKNPYDIFGSFYLRFGDEYLDIPDHRIQDYENHVKHFLNTDDFKIKYEHLNEHSLPLIFDFLGLQYEGIKERDACAGVLMGIPNDEPENQKEGDGHVSYRTWQINQPFQNKTGESAKHLPPACRELLAENEIIKQLYI